MMSLLGLSLALVAVPLCLLVCVFIAQVLAQVFWPVSTALPYAGADRPRLAVLVPAHNEASVIEATLGALQQQLRQGDRLLVVADNCDDATAELARLQGAEVSERFDLSHRGKGFALAHGMASLQSDPPAMVVIVDADCQLAAGALDALIDSVATLGRPAQALYLMLSPTGAGLSRRLAEFAWRVRNWVRPGGWYRWGMPCQLMGTGMAFEWGMLQSAQLANDSIVEDMKLGLDLAVAGCAPVFCAAAKVTSQFPETDTGTASQRTRWEHGHLEMILREVPRLLVRALRHRDLSLLGMALDLAVPPLALLAGALLVACCAAFCRVAHGCHRLARAGSGVGRVGVWCGCVAGLDSTRT